jgi:hypothetical protein
MLDEDGWRTLNIFWLDLEEEDDDKMFNLNVIMNDEESSQRCLSRRESIPASMLYRQESILAYLSSSPVPKYCCKILCTVNLL